MRREKERKKEGDEKSRGGGRGLDLVDKKIIIKSVKIRAALVCFKIVGQFWHITD